MPLGTPKPAQLDLPQHCPICASLWEGEWPYYWSDPRHAGGTRVPGGRKAIVFVHGVFSSHCAFGALWQAFANDPAFADWNLDAYDYNFWVNIPDNGTVLFEQLRQVFTPEDEVTLLCHSMGGLVGRVAILKHGDAMPFVRRLVMLGTPNHGTLHSGRLGLLAQMSRKVMATMWSLAPRRQGIKQLSEVGKMLREEQLLEPQNRARTEAVEYLSIPGLCYHEDSEPFSARPSAMGQALQGLNLSLQLLSALPLWRVGLTIPHDGIVEDSSVYLGSGDKQARDSERIQLCEGDLRRAEGNYVHCKHPGYKDVDHVGLQSARLTFETLKGVLLSESLESWSQSVPKWSAMMLKPGRFVPRREPHRGESAGESQPGRA